MKKTYDEYYTNYVLFLLIIRTLNIVINYSFVIDAPSALITKYGLMFVLLCALITVFLYAEHKVQQLMIIYELVSILFVIVSLLRYPQYAELIINKCSWFIMGCIPVLIITRSIKNIDIVMDYFSKYSILLTILMIFFFFNDKSRLSSNMVFSYTYLLPLCIQLNNLIEKNGICDFLLALAGVIMLVLKGSRGGLFCCAIFIIAKFFLTYRTKKSTMLRDILLISCLCIIAIFRNFFENLTNGTLVNNGLYSRNIHFLVDNNFFDDTGRYAVYLLSINKSLEKFLWGWGIFGHVSFVSSSPHNIFIEFIVNFGWIVGNAVSVFLIFLILRCIVMKPSVRKSLLIILCCSGFLPLLFSTSYLEFPVFWIFIGMASAEQDGASKLKYGGVLKR